VMVIPVMESEFHLGGNVIQKRSFLYFYYIFIFLLYIFIFFIFK